MTPSGVRLRLKTQVPGEGVGVQQGCFERKWGALEAAFLEDPGAWVNVVACALLAIVPESGRSLALTVRATRRMTNDWARGAWDRKGRANRRRRSRDLAAPSSTTCQSLAIAPSLKTLESEEEVREAEAKAWEHVVFRGRQTEVVVASSAE
ncbi:hypothetical protein MHU86_23427 [Fragilaria crotonensis]|nr:hypothetical protein MHU86_23427 [Fragilaria crotonensis]